MRLFQILTTIGYGNYHPQEDLTRLVISLLAVPTIGLFCWSLSFGARLMLMLTGLVDELIQTWWYRVRHHGSNKTDNAATMLRRIVDDGRKASLSASDMIPVVRVMEKDLLHLGEVGGKPETATKLLKRELDSYFAAVDGQYCRADGTIDLMEAQHIMHRIQKCRERTRRQTKAEKSVAIGAFLCVVMVLLGTLVFNYLEPEWGLLNSFYFCVITSTRYSPFSLTQMNSLSVHLSLSLN
jgi:hypothetical protein